MIFDVAFNSSPDDSEKALLPALLWECAKESLAEGEATAYVLTLGWWHWSVSFYVGILRR